MTAGAGLRIAQVCPYAWPPQEDVAEHVAALAAALARRSHGVTVLAPRAGRPRSGEGRRRREPPFAGDASTLAADLGEVRVQLVGRALAAPPGRRLAVPTELGWGLELALAQGDFDVVHLHEPLAPSPALAALGRARGARVVEFHRPELLAGVAFLSPLVDRALERVDARLAASGPAAAALAGILPGDYTVVPPGVSGASHGAAGGDADGLALVARARDRAAARFALAVARAVDAPTGPITLIGPRDAPWRTRAAVPKALRERVTVVPDAGGVSRCRALAGARIALVASPEDASGPTLAEAMAAGCAVIAPRCREVEGVVAHGEDAMLVAPFSRAEWGACLDALLRDPARCAALGAAARRWASGRSWDATAERVEAVYVDALSRPRATRRRDSRVQCDLRVRPEPGVGAVEIVAACRARRIDVVAIASPEGLGPARAVAAAAPPEITVIPGQEVATAEGTVVGLFLEREVPAGRTLRATAEAIHAQGGLVLCPHPGAAPIPSADALQREGGAIDCFELACASGASDPADAALARRLGLVGCATSGARRPRDIGALVTDLERFDGPAGLIAALPRARLRRGGRRAGRHAS